MSVRESYSESSSDLSVPDLLRPEFALDLLESRTEGGLTPKSLYESIWTLYESYGRTDEYVQAILTRCLPNGSLGEFFREDSPLSTVLLFAWNSDPCHRLCKRVFRRFFQRLLENVDSKPLELCKMLLADLLESADEWPVSFRLLFGIIRTQIITKYELTDSVAVEEILRLFLLRVLVPPVRIPENFRLLKGTPPAVAEVLKECTALLMAVATNNSTGATVAQLAFVGYARPLLVGFMLQFSQETTAKLLYKSFHGSLEPSLRKLWQWRAVRDVHTEPDDDGPVQLSRAGSSKEELTLHRLSEVDSYYSFDSIGDAKSKLKAYTDPDAWTRLESLRKKFWIGSRSGASKRKFSTQLPQAISTVYDFFHNAGTKAFRSHFPHMSESTTGPGPLWKLRIKLPGGFHSRSLEMHRYDHFGDDSAYCFGETLETPNKNPRELLVLCFYMEIDGNGTRLTAFMEFLESTPEQLVRLWSETLFDDLASFRKKFCSKRSSADTPELRSKPSPNNSGINRVSRSNSSQLSSPPVQRSLQ